MKTSDNYKQILTTYKLDHPDMDGLNCLLEAIDTQGWLPDTVTLVLDTYTAYVYFGEDHTFSVDMDAISGFTLGLHAIGYECTTEDESPMIYT